MKKAMAPLAGVLTVLTALLAVMWMRYARDVRQIEQQGDSSTVYGRHYVMIGQEKSGMWQSIYESAREAAAGEGAYLEWTGEETASDYRAADFLRIAIASRVDGIILYADGSQEITGLIDEAMEAGIPVVTVLGDDTESQRVSYVGVNSYQLGEICGEQVLSLLEEGENHIMMLTDPASEEDVSTNLMYAQMNQVIARGRKASQQVEISISPIEGNTNFDAEEVIRDIFVNSGTLPDILICPSTTAAECVCQAVVDYNQVGNVDIIGYYASDTIADAIERGLMSMTISLDVEEIGELCVGALEEYITQGYVSNYFNVGLDVVTKENVRRYQMMQTGGEV